jgi:hypothetical protein
MYLDRITTKRVPGKVTQPLNMDNREIVQDTIPYIIEVHKNYPFSDKPHKEAERYLKENFKDY